MSGFTQVGDLEINEDLKHQQIMWRIERIVWAILAIFLLAVLLGFFGRGHFSMATAGKQGSALWVKYDKYGRNGAPTRIQVFFGPGTANEGKIRLFIDRNYLDNVEINNINPEPENVETRPDWYVYVFSVPDTSKPVAITFHVQPLKTGRLPAKMALEGSPALHLNQLIYP